MLQKYQEHHLPTPSLDHEVTSPAETIRLNNSDFEDFLASLDFEVQKGSPSPEAIERLRNSNLPIFNKITLLLTALGEKSASSIVVSSEDWMDGEPEKELPEDTASEVLEIAPALGLHVCTRDILDSSEEELGTHWRTRLYSVSLSEQNAQILRDVFRSKDKIDDLILGKVLGFPDTAVAAYVAQDEMISANEYPHETLEDKVFSQFRMSAENYNTELQTVRRWAQAVKKADELLYNEALLTRKVYDPSLYNPL
jgi:hypothetical protein